MLPQKPAPRRRKLILRRLVTWSGLPFLGVITTFGYLPQINNSPVIVKTVEDKVVLPYYPQSSDIGTFWHNDRVIQGDTPTKLLHRLSVKDIDAENYINHANDASSFRKLATGKIIQAETDTNGSLLALRYQAASGKQTIIERNGSNFSVRVLPAELEQREFMSTGVIKTTLYAATDEAELPEQAATQLADIFGGDIDFHQDLAPGDKFSVIYEMTYSNGEPLHFSRILAAEFVNHKESHRALYFQPKGEQGAYYTPEGRSLHKPYLRSPVEFSRISSGYTAARFHPILHKWRAHRGVDYAAPIGTKVKATAAGTVDFVGKKTGYGNLVIIKHEGRYSTAYGHLSHFASGLRPGRHVTQGEIIGYVGQTGWATGPHLHYEFRIDGQQRNPQYIAQSDVPPITEAQNKAFLTATRNLNSRLGMLRSIVLAQLN